MDIIGKLNDWTLFIYKNLSGLFSTKAEICRTWKINASYILSSSPKSCWSYTIILKFSYSAYIYVQNLIRVYDLIEQISCYFTECESISCWTIWRRCHSNTSIALGTWGQNEMKKTVKFYPEVFEFKIFVWSNI